MSRGKKLRAPDVPQIVDFQTDTAGMLGPNGLRVLAKEDGQAAITMFIDGEDRFWVSYDLKALDNLIVVLHAERKKMKAKLRELQK